MKAVLIPALGAVLLASPAFAADLGGYEEREYVERAAPPATVVERERTVERRYYEPAPVVRKRADVVVVPEARVDVVVPRREVLVYDDVGPDVYWRPRQQSHGAYGHRWGRHNRW